MAMAEADFQQRVFASSVGPLDPKLFWKIFDPARVPGNDVPDAENVFFPTTDEEFEEMLRVFEEQEQEAGTTGAYPEAL